MKPLVTWLKVKRAKVSELTLIEKVQNKVKLKTINISPFTLSCPIITEFLLLLLL